MCSRGGKIIGYAYAHKHRLRTAYQWRPESSVYLAEGFHRMGIGKILYEALFSILKLQGYFNVYAGVGLPNVKSVKFHKALGFEEVGIFKKIGYKKGNWHDTHWFQLHLAEHIINPHQPKIISQIQCSGSFKAIMSNANEQLENVRS